MVQASRARQFTTPARALGSRRQRLASPQGAGSGGPKFAVLFRQRRFPRADDPPAWEWSRPHLLSRVEDVMPQLTTPFKVLKLAAGQFHHLQSRRVV
jgi:hypothetical protein